MRKRDRLVFFLGEKEEEVTSGGRTSIRALLQDLREEQEQEQEQEEEEEAEEEGASH